MVVQHLNLSATGVSYQHASARANSVLINV